MPGISAKLPLVRTSRDGFYKLNKTHKAAVAQNLKSLIMTSPGERIMDPEFGVGIKNYLFEMNTESTYADLAAKIHQQVNKYLPFINIVDIKFSNPNGGDYELADINSLGVKMEYVIVPLSVPATLKLTVSKGVIQL